MAGVPKLAAGAPARPGGAAADPERLSRLRRVAQEFESLLVGQLMRSLRATIPSSGLIDDQGDIKYYRQMYDDALARGLSSGRRGLGIADLIMRQYSGGSPNAGAAPIAPVSREAWSAPAPDDPWSAVTLSGNAEAAGAGEDEWPLVAGAPAAGVGPGSPPAAALAAAGLPSASGAAPRPTSPASAVPATTRPPAAARNRDALRAYREQAAAGALASDPITLAGDGLRGAARPVPAATRDPAAAREADAARPTEPAALRRAAEDVGGATADTLRRFEPEITRAAQATGVDPALLLAVLVQESGGDPRARSPHGAVGLMQLMPATAADVGVRQPWHPGQNILGGARYLARLLERFGRSLDLALAGYNAGPGAVARHGDRVPPYAETRDYVRKVADLYARLRGGDGTELAKEARSP